MVERVNGKDAGALKEVRGGDVVAGSVGYGDAAHGAAVAASQIRNILTAYLPLYL